jgi:hypothetical protein
MNMNFVDNYGNKIERSKMKSAVKLLMLFTGVLLFICQTAYADSADSNNPKRGVIKATITDAITDAPLIGAAVMLVNTKTGAATDLNGKATISNIPVGGYTIAVRLIGYEPSTLTDIIVRPERITFVEARLAPSTVESQTVVVTGGYFNNRPSQPTSAISFNAEEIRRSPGTAGDVSRILTILPSVSKVDDQMNNLVVRGGTPAENAFFIDNIEVPNINHYPVEGATGGPIGLVNTDFIQDVDFSAGGFPAKYGDRLSSIMEMNFREGNRDEFDGQVDLHMAGFGLTVEGPMANKRGSYLASARRSFLDFLVDAIGTGVAPKYSDYQAKVVYDVTPSDKISFIGIGGIDNITFSKKQSSDDGNPNYGDYKSYEYASGLNWRHIWDHKGFSNTSMAVLGTRYDYLFRETKSDSLLSDILSNNRAMQIRNVNVYQLNKTDYLEFGFDGKYYFSEFNNHYGSYTNALGDTMPPLDVVNEVNSPAYGLHSSITYRPFAALTGTFGLRYDYFDYNKHSHVSPRFSFGLRLSDKLTVNGATGIYYQNLPVNILAQKESNKDLKDLEATHYVLGMGYLLTDNTKFTLEGYYKHYRNFPIDPSQPKFFAADLTSYYGFFGNYDRLEDKGIARVYGVEATLQKKLVKGLYGLASVSYSKAEYKSLDNIWRDRMFDNRVIVGLEGGYKPNNRWEYSARWVFAGGIPYTPLDLAASQAINRSVYDGNMVNASRYPNYHSLNIRVDRRFLFSKSNLILYFSIWNVYNRKNVSTYYWNEIERKQEVRYQWSMLPIFGVEFEF